MLTSWRFRFLTRADALNTVSGERIGSARSRLQEETSRGACCQRHRPSFGLDWTCLRQGPTFPGRHALPSQNRIRMGVQANEAIAAIRDVGLGKPTEGCLCVQLYDALNLAWHLFIDDARPKSLLAITEGIDYARGKTFKQAVSRAQQLQVSCDVALVADHPFQGSKSIQKYGFYLRRLAGKTHGRYIEVGREQIKVPRSVDRLTESIRDQGSGDKEASQ